MDKDDVKQMFDRVKKATECPICLETVRPPILQCDNGHISCKECSEPLSECSVCREPFNETKNRVVEELLDILPKSCPYADKGCKAIDLIDSHVTVCEFRPITCIVGENRTCNWSGTVRKWKEHVTTVHSDRDVKLTEDYKFNQPRAVSIKNFDKDWKIRRYCHKVEEEYFLFCICKEGNRVYQTFSHVQCKKPKQEYYFRVKLDIEEQIFYKSLMVCTPFNHNDPKEETSAIFLKRELDRMAQDGSVRLVVEALKVEPYHQVQEQSNDASDEGESERVSESESESEMNRET